MTRVVKEEYICDQTYRGFASRGLQSPFLPVPLRGTPLLPNNSPGLQSWVVFSPLFYPCPYGAHRFFPIIAQGFNPGWPFAPAVAQRVGQEIKKAPKATPWELFPLY